MTTNIARARARQITVEWVDPALVLAFDWAGSDEGRLEIDSLCAFVELIRVLDQYAREVGR